MQISTRRSRRAGEKHSRFTLARSFLSVADGFLLIFVRSFCERRKVLATRASSKRKFKPLLLLLLIPFIALCWPPFYNFRDPELAGIPFFYWFQLLWIVITAIITAVVYLLDT
jgi:phosphatidylglycerophosphate synthase